MLALYACLTAPLQTGIKMILLFLHIPGVHFKYTNSYY